MEYTPNRRYPYPSSPREAGNGGLASQLLAEAVARDLDTLGAGWAAAATRPSKILGFAADTTSFSASGRLPFTTDTIKDVRGAAYFTTSATEICIATGGAGWYFVNLNFGAAPVGSVTVDAHLENWIKHLRPSASGNLDTVEERHGDTYWPSTTANCYNRVSGLFQLLDGDRVWGDWAHTNTASSVKMLAATTTLQVTRLRGL